MVNSPSLVAAVDRQPKLISFAPYLVQFSKRILVPSEAAVNALADDIHGEKGPVGCRPETLKAMHVTLAPGEDLDASTKVFLVSLSRLLDPIQTDSNDGTTGLFAFTRRIITQASTDAIYGSSKNPFHDPAVESGFWYVPQFFPGIKILCWISRSLTEYRAIDKDFAYLGLNVRPDVIAPTGSRGRKALFQGMRNYYDQNGQESASGLIKARYEVNRKFGMSIDDIAHFDLAVSYGLLVNTVPATAWSLLNLYSRPSLLEEIRTSVMSHVRALLNSSGKLTRSVDMAGIAAGCPLLVSLVQETLRVQSTNASTRMVLKDTYLEDKYYLKKRSVLLVPSAELHSKPAIWGPTVGEFDPWRFTKKRKGAPPVPASAWRAYGSGASVCPGRFLAANEVMIVLVIMMLKYDLEPVQGEWTSPPSRPHITTSILTPLKDVLVRITPREKDSQDS